MEIKNRKVNMKGFTLIELLAVIIILAIIALIAVPTIMTIIDNSKKSAAEDSTYGLLSAAENYSANYMMENNGATPTEITLDNVKSYIRGTAPSAATFSVTNNEITVTGATFGDFTCGITDGKAACNKKK